MLFDEMTCIQEVDRCHEKMCDEEVLLAASAAMIVFLSTVHRGLDYNSRWTNLPKKNLPFRAENNLQGT